MNPADPDLWHRLALGEALWLTGHFPPGDYFSYLADYKSIADHEWGSAVIFFALYSWAGLNIFIEFKLATLLLTLMLVVWAGLYHRRPTMRTAAFYALILVALLPNFQSTIRCMSFSHVFFALWLYFFQRERYGRIIPFYFYPLTMLIWANLHGGFVLGLVWLLAVTAVEWLDGGYWKKWLVRFGLSLTVTLINPFGVQLWVSTVRALRVPRSGFSEWEPVSWWADPMSYAGYKLLLIGLIVALIMHVHRRGWVKVDRPAILLIGTFMCLSFVSARHTSFFAVVVGALAPGLFVEESDSAKERDPLKNLLSMALSMTILIVPLYSALLFFSARSPQLEYPHVSCPQGAVTYLQEKNVRGNLLVPFNYGSYALWNLRGQMRVSMDGRYDLVYSPKTYKRVDDFFFARGDWHDLLNSPAPDAILVPIADPVYKKLKTEPGWDEVYRDDTDAVFLPLRVAVR